MSPQEKQRAYYLANREKIIARSRAWHAENREQANKRRRAYDLAKSDEVRAKRAVRYLRDRDIILAKQRQKNALNPEPNRVRVKKWREELSPEKRASHYARRQERAVERRGERPDKYRIERARRTLVLTTGIPAAYLNEDVVETKAAQLAVFDAIKDRGLCRRGHPMTPDNVYMRPSTGSRDCRKCMAVRNRRRSRKANEAAQ